MKRSEESTSDPISRPSSALVAGAMDDVRVGPILALPTVLTELGVTPREVFAKAGVDQSLFDDPDHRIGFGAVGRLLERCVAVTKCSHFGLLVGDRFDLKGLGAIGYLMRHSPSVGEALRGLLLHLHLHDKGAAPLLLTQGRTRVILGYSIYRHGVPGIEQIYDTAITIAYKMMRQLCGPTWKPMHVQFSYGSPPNIVPYRRVFSSSVLFNAEISGIAFASSWLEKPIEGADAALHAVLAKAIWEEEAKLSMSFAEQVERVLHQLVLSGTATADSVAGLFGIHERTLRRRLEKEGKNLLQLINAARFELAQQLLENTNLSVTEIAAALHYADTAAFSRAFRNWAGSSPVQWRSRPQRAGRFP